MLCRRCVVWWVVARCVVLGCAVAVVCGCVSLRFVVVFTLCGVVWGCSASWCVVFRVGTWWFPRVTSSVLLLCCAVFPCVLVLCRAFRGAALCRGVRLCVLRWGWFGVGLCHVVLCGAVSCGVVVCLVAFRCGALPCDLLRTVVLLLLILVGFDGFWFCGVVCWHVLWPLSLLYGFLMACFCWYVTCASFLRRVALCYVLLCSIVMSYGSFIVSWAYVCCVAVSCRGALGCMFVCGVWYRHAVLHVVAWQFVATCSMMCCIMAYRCLVVCFWGSVSCWRACCFELCLGVAWRCGIGMLVALHCCVM